jgi:hypothetical protein
MPPSGEEASTAPFRPFRLLAESEYEIAKLVGALEAEGNNGGFDQFFYNSAGDNTAETIRALETIGAVTVSDILKRAAAKFPGNTYLPSLIQMVRKSKRPMLVNF